MFFFFFFCLSYGDLAFSGDHPGLAVGALGMSVLRIRNAVYRTLDEDLEDSQSVYARMKWASQDIRRENSREVCLIHISTYLHISSNISTPKPIVLPEYGYKTVLIWCKYR